MAGGHGSVPPRNKLRRGGLAARRAWPMVLMAWERWQALPEADKERYRRRAREYADRGRRAVVRARQRRYRGR
ncbi:MAG: hypothetical protein ACR2J6_03050 [Thermoleophilaceae bacterium]